MNDFWKTLRRTPIRHLIRHGLGALDERNWKKTRGGWLLSGPAAVQKEEPAPMLTFAVRLILEEDGKFLFLKQTPQNGGRYTLVGGNVEAAEFAREALCREANEEIGVKLTPDRLTLVHVLHRKKRELNQNFVVFYFKAAKYKGEPESQERKKFNNVEWFPAYALPLELSKHTLKVLNRIARGEMYSELPKR